MLILDLTYSQYIAVKSVRKVVILKDEAEIIEKNYIEETKYKLEKQGYVGLSINYEQLQVIYQKYGKQMAESEFARKVLEIGHSQYTLMKRGIRNSIILKSLIKRVIQREIEKIKQELEMQGYIEKKINYSEFQNLYRQYGSGMPEYEICGKGFGNISCFIRKYEKITKS